MGIFAKIRERSKIVKFLVNAQKTIWYPIVFALICMISGSNNYTVYIPLMYLLVSFVLFSVLFTDDNKVFLTPLCMIYFAIGLDYAPGSFHGSNGDMMSFMNPEALKHIIIIGIIGVGSFLIRLAFDGSIAAALTKRRHFTWGIIAMDIAFILNGAFSSVYDPVNLSYGALLAMGFTVVYFLVSGMLDKSEDPITYGCYAIVGTSYIALGQILPTVIKLISEDKYFIIDGYGNIYISRGEFSLGWGVATVIGAILVLGIPAAMYLAKNRRGCFFWVLSCSLFLLCCLVINSRSALLVGAVIFVICIISSCITRKNRIKIILSIISVAIFSLISAYQLIEYIVPEGRLTELFRLSFTSDSGRFALWENGISDFKSSPIFGIGFNDGGYLNSVPNNFYSRMYHCICVQLPAAMGIVGCIAFLLHFVQLAILLFKRFSLNKLLLLAIPLMILLMSLFDNFFFYLDFQIFYGLALALAEFCLRPDNCQYKAPVPSSNPAD